MAEKESVYADAESETDTQVSVFAVCPDAVGTGYGETKKRGYEKTKQRTSLYLVSDTAYGKRTDGAGGGRRKESGSGTGERKFLSVV